MEQKDFSIEVSESAIKEFADYLYQRENAKATVKKYMADIKKLFSSPLYVSHGASNTFLSYLRLFY